MSGLDQADLRALTTCLECSGSRVVPDIFGDYVLCHACTLLPREPRWTGADGDADLDL